MKNTVQIKRPSDIYSLLEKWTKKREENFLTVTLNGNHDVIRVYHTSKGLANKTIVHLRECFYPAIKDNATAIVFAHNHPSGHVFPSKEDDEIFERLLMASKILGFDIVDFVIIARQDIYSYKQYGKFEKEYTDDELKLYSALMAAEKKGVV